MLGFSLQYRVVVLIAAGALMIFGALRVRDTPVGVLPELSPTVVEVQTEALGLSAVEIEDLVTVNMEELLAGTPWLKSMRSKSVPSLSSVLLVFEPGTDVMRARQVVSERLLGAHALPNVSKKPVMLQPLSTESRAMIVGLSSKDVPLIDMSVVARWTVVPKLLGVPGVANVAIWGQRARQLQVQVDPNRLREHGVTLNQVVKSTGEALWVSPLSYLEASMPGAGGWIDTPNQRLGIQHKQPITTAAELAKVAVEGASVTLGDIARVVEEHPPLIGDAIVKGGPGLLLVVEKFPQANTSEVTRGVEAALRELGHGMPGIDIDSHVFRATTFADSAADNLKLAALLGALCLAVVLFLAHSHWRGALISLAAVAMSLMAAALVLYFRKATIDTMVLVGLVVALAALIDDAVNDVEIVLTKLRAPHAEGGIRSTAALIYEACLETRAPLAYATLVAVLALVPLFLIGGPLGALLTPSALSYILAVVASTLVAVTVTPALAVILLRNVGDGRHEAVLVRWSRRGYGRAMEGMLASGSRNGLVGLAALALLLAIMPLLPWSVIPSFKEQDVRVSWQAVPGTSHPEMQRIMTQAVHDLRQVAGVRSVAAHIGRAITGDQVVGMESGQIWLGLHADANHDATVAAIRQRVADYPGLDVKVETYLTDKARHVMTSARDEVTVRLQGLERNTLRREAEKVKEMLTSVPGLRNVRVGSQAQAPEVEIEVDLAAAGRVGLKPGDVRRAAATVFAGLEVGNLFEQQKVFDVVVWGTPEIRKSLTNLTELLIDLHDGGHVRLADVAKVSVASAPAVIEREGISRFLDVRADVTGRSMGSVLSDVEGRLQKMTFPLEYHAAVLRDHEERQARSWRVLLGAAIAAGMIFLLVQACFQSWRLASLFAVSLLMALAGGIVGVLAGGGTLLLGSLAGFLSVLAVAARHGVLLLSRIQNLELDDAHSDAARTKIVEQAVQERYGPVLVSTAAIVAALLPAIALGSVAGLEILHPVALVIVAGVLASALVTLFLVPSLYLSFTSRPAMQTLGGEQHAV
jgi:Cu/Ag efflux pump CusA